MYYLLLYGANRVRSVTQRMPRAWGVCAVCVYTRMCLSAIARGGRHIFTSRCLPRTPGGFVGIFIYFIFFSTPNFSTKTAHTFTYNVQYNAQVLYIYVYRGVIHAVYNTLYYIIIIHRCQWNGENWLLIIIILIYIYIRIKYCVCVSTPFVARAIRSKSSSSCCCFSYIP